jgi:UDP-3-O-[3-hydroxymyristoyl] glucosamine N-acyltransferase
VGDNEVVQGSPAFNFGDFAKSYIHFKNLPKIAADLEEVKKKQ